MRRTRKAYADIIQLGREHAKLFMLKRAGRAKNSDVEARVSATLRILMAGNTS